MLDWRDPDVLRSRALQPLYYKAPHPEELPNRMTVKPFQYAGVEYRLGHRHGIFGDEPGLTKTAQSIMTSNAIEAKKTLCIVPASLRYNWEREIWAWSTIENVKTYPIVKASDGVSFSSDYVIVSYDLLRNDAIFDAIMDQRWDHLILDEAHMLKDPKGNKRTHRIMAENGINSVCEYMTALTGTLMPNQPRECYNIMRLFNWLAIDGMTFDDFEETFYAYGGGMVRRPVYDSNLGCFVNKVHWSNQVRNVPCNLGLLQWLLRKHYMVRRDTDAALPQLPKTTWHVFPIVPDAGIRKAMKHPGWAAAEKLYDMAPEEFDMSIPPDGAISSAMRELGEAKAPAVADYIEELLLSGVKKIVVGAWHISVLDYLAKRLGEYGLAYMDGRTSPKLKQAAVDQFQNDPGIQIILGQYKPLGEGWTLTAAQDAVAGELYWVPGIMEQFIRRIRRMGQEGDRVIGHVPVVPNTLDERATGTMITKGRNIHASLDKDYLQEGTG